ncbi:UBC-like protein [Phlegmacium glaucopus]|nr:UBC-like protein [Phlegmacium glaucopus]
MSTLNKNNSAIKRIMQEARELANDPCTDYSAAPLEDDIFEWHCTIRGPTGTEYEGGLYHFRILLPAEYPFRPPSIMMLTPNGRFELNSKICISFTNYHEELWQPAWGVRTAIIGLQGFFPLKGQAAVGVGSIEYPAGERKRLASLSRDWTCPHCQQTNLELLPDPPSREEEAGQKKWGIGNVLGSQMPDEQLVVPDVGPAEVSSATSKSTVSGSAEHLSTRPTTEVTIPETPRSRVQEPRQSSKKPPMLLDTAICILLVLLFAIICRRIV